MNSNFEGPGWVLRFKEISARRVPLKKVPHSQCDLWCAQYIKTRREPTFTQVLQREIPRTVAKTSMEPIHSTGIVQRLLMLYFELLYVPYRKGSQSCLASANPIRILSAMSVQAREIDPIQELLHECPFRIWQRL